MQLPGALTKLIEALQRLPGVGPKSAARMAFYLLVTPDHFNENLAEAVRTAKSKIRTCGECFGIGEGEKCSICSDEKRDRGTICVVERQLDVVALESVGGYLGVYHVLGGVINPLEHVAPEDLKIDELVERVRNDGVREIIIATNPTMEGEATALYIKKRIESLEKQKIEKLKITRIGSGLPIGADLGYADQATLARAMEGRRGL